MATQAYYDWDNAGRPFQLATPVSNYRADFKAAGWPGSSIGTIGDEAHLQANYPQDHCPFSVTGWPFPHPYPYVTAIDILHDGVREAQLDRIVSQWVADARGGETPWVKYIVYKGQLWSVKSGWETQAATGHYDHVHMSVRTDHVETSIGAYNPTTSGGTEMDQSDKDIAWATTNRALALLLGGDAVYRVSDENADRTETNVLQATLARIVEALARLESRPPFAIDPFALAEALVAQQGFVDALATAVAAKLGMIPQAREIAKAVGELAWHGRAE